MDSPSVLHMQHQLTAIIPRRRKLSAVKIFPQAAIQTKKATLGETLAFQILFQGKEPIPLEVS